MKFLIDGMLGKLARWLRLMGYDAKYSISSDKALIAEAARENRVLLTSDVALYREATLKGVEAYLIKGKNEAERIAEVAKRFKLRINIDVNSSRCPLCGHPLLKIDKNFVKGKVPQRTFKAYEEFWVCQNKECEKIYWRGSHWKKINEVLLQARNWLREELDGSKG